MIDLSVKTTEWLIEAVKSYGYSVVTRAEFYRLCPVAEEIIRERLFSPLTTCSPIAESFTHVVFDPEDGTTKQWFLAGAASDLREIVLETCEMISDGAYEGPLGEV